MQTCPVSVLPMAARPRPRSALLASADCNFRQRLSDVLMGMRWQVREANTGAQAWAEADAATPEAVIVDSWLPDLDLGEFLSDFRSYFPGVDLVTADGASPHESPRGPHRQELLYALRRIQDADTAAWHSAPTLTDSAAAPSQRWPGALTTPALPRLVRQIEQIAPQVGSGAQANKCRAKCSASCERLAELIGEAPCMLEVSKRVRLVAPRSTQVLIEGPTGSGKELVAKALHRLSPRSRKPMVAINCAAIPEALLEAELFGHTRGAFTGAVQGRVGRIEAADGGTLFLDEIGEMPLALQSKLLRFVETGELQRVGDNESVKVDVRIIAATHQPLSQHAQAGSFRADLYYRLAVFLIHTPSLADHLGDLALLVDHFLEQMGREHPVKRINAGAMVKLAAHTWPGNVRELEHVLERAAILSGEEPVLTAEEIDFGVTVN